MMDEETTNLTVAAPPPKPEMTDTPNEPEKPDFPPLELAALQEMSPAALQEWYDGAGVRPHPGRTRHQLILDLVRHAVGRGQPVRTSGFLELPNDGPAVLRSPRYNFLPLPGDVGVPHFLIRQFGLRPGQSLAGTIRGPRDREKGMMLDRILTIESVPADEWQAPTAFDSLTPLYPDGRIMLENETEDSVCMRAVDLLTPLGRGQRGLIVAPPRVGKTILLKQIAKAIRINHPEIVLIILLVDERPEEVTDLEREVDCQIYSSTFDEPPTRHVQVAELVSERAKRLVEQKKDVVLLLDSITRLARGYNSLVKGKGRTMSGGVESKALLKPKRFFGAARNVEEGGSLTILATALIETGSRMDEVIFEEFKGTGNMELHLDRSLVEKRLYPAIHIQQSGTRREDLLYHPEEWERVKLLRKTMAALPPLEAMEQLIRNLHATKTNAELLLAGLR
ncbi:MAG TPA: transcription termination factor Rho [Chthoniobacterales bacterium]|jgi:transcription termination factor Rho|nr:transcription termination factor Rho [Chthoniobacterales bacterium]